MVSSSSLYQKHDPAILSLMLTERNFKHNEDILVNENAAKLYTGKMPHVRVLLDHIRRIQRYYRLIVLIPSAIMRTKGLFMGVYIAPADTILIHKVGT